jgi:xanthine/uracil permease
MPPSATSPRRSDASKSADARDIRLAALLSIASSLLVGVVLIVAPWTAFWEANWMLQPWPALRELLLNGFARGAISGLGLVNVLVALADLHGRLLATPRRG